MLLGKREARVVLARGVAAPATMRATVAAAEALLAGQWPIFAAAAGGGGGAAGLAAGPGVGEAGSAGVYAFDVPYRDEALVGNAKYVWELSRHQATTVLASAWWLTGEERFAEGVRTHLTSWWDENPFLCGMHWTGGIETGLRSISWVWIRALLAEWPGVRALFDDNEAFVGQLYHHLIYLRRLHSRGSSSNNHLIAELAGMVAACAAFPWFRESAGWGAWARDGLAAQAEAQTHPDGANREQASEYHGFVFEILAGTALAVRLAGGRLDRVEAVMRADGRCDGGGAGFGGGMGRGSAMGMMGGACCWMRRRLRPSGSCWMWAGRCSGRGIGGRRWGRRCWARWRGRSVRRSGCGRGRGRIISPGWG